MEVDVLVLCKQSDPDMALFCFAESTNQNPEYVFRGGKVGAAGKKDLSILQVGLGVFSLPSAREAYELKYEKTCDSVRLIFE